MCISHQYALFIIIIHAIYYTIPQVDRYLSWHDVCVHRMISLVRILQALMHPTSNAFDLGMYLLPS